MPGRIGIATVSVTTCSIGVTARRAACTAAGDKYILYHSNAVGMPGRKAKAIVVTWRTTAKGGVDAVSRRTIKESLASVLKTYNAATACAGLHTAIKVRYEW